MDLRRALKEIKFDKRLVDFNRSQGQLSKEEWEATLNRLPDLADQAEPLNLDSNKSDRDRFS